MTPAAILFDDGSGELAPLTDLRPAFDLRTGALTTRDRLTRLLGLKISALFVCPAHEPLARAQADVPVNALPANAADLLWLNARCVLPPPGVADLPQGHALTDAATGTLLAARTSTPTSPPRTGPDVPALVSSLVNPSTRQPVNSALLARPWHIRTHRDAALAADLALLRESLAADAIAPPPHTLTFGDHPLTIHRTARLYPGVILDTESGPIVIDEHAVLRPACTIIGPAYIGPGSTVLDRTIIKGQTAIGPACKIAGEVGGTIFQGQANKAHDGHLGDSWVGQWANLGAGTTNSNLLNTYAEVTMRAAPDARLERTGQQFMGAIIGDHVKTAICTRIMTGTILGTGVMYAATAAASGTIAPFAWCTDEGRQRFRLDKFTDIARTVMARRKFTAPDAYWAALNALHTASGT